MTSHDDDRIPASSPSDRIPHAYLAFGATVGVVFLLVAVASLLIALRQWIWPSSGDDFGSGLFGPTIEDSDAALRSLLGALAWAIPAVLVLWWHRTRSWTGPTVDVDGAGWGRILFAHLVAAVALVIATGATVALLSSLRDSVVRECFPSFSGGGSVVAPAPSAGATPPPLISESPPIELPIDPGFAPEPECYPERGDAFRSAVDAGLVTLVAGGTWGWALRRGRRLATPPPTDA